MPTSGAQVTSLRGKFVRLLLVVSLLMSVSTTSILVLMSAQASSEHLAAVQRHIEDGIISKGKVLTEQHALLLRSLALDNAFSDMQRLVARAVSQDGELVYGLFVTDDGTTLAECLGRVAPDKDELPAKDAWRDLGLRREELLVKTLSVKRVTRLGRDLLEVAVPVLSEEGESFGTIRYGLSTERMHAALAQAKRESDSRSLRSVLLMIGLVSLVTGIGLVLSRAQAVHITEPVGALRQAAEALARGDRAVRVDIQSGDELALLGSSFNRMIDELDGSYRELERMNRTLEQKVEARTAELAHNNRAMRLVLDNVDQGLVNLSADGVMAGECSAILSQWFGAPERDRTFWDYIGKFSSSFGASFREAWLQVEDAVLPLAVCLGQLPSQLRVGERTWSFRYLPLQGARGEDELEGVLIVIAEVTDRLAREREEAEHREQIEAFKKLMVDRRGFMSFLQEATLSIQQIASPSASADMDALRRCLHTFKGNAGMMGLGVIAHLCNELETQLAEQGDLDPRTVDDLRARWTAITDDVAALTGAVGRRVVEVPEAEYTALLARFSPVERRTSMFEQLSSWRLEPASKSMARLAYQAKALARRLGRGDIEVAVTGDEVLLEPEYWAPFFAELVHVVRNAVDHGLESPSERLRVGKRAQGSLALKAHIDRDQLCFEVSDDGRGIDWAAIVQRAKARGLPHSNQAELLDALCADGVTTCDTPGEISGRGVGMAALRQKVDALSGRLEVHSVKGVGTTWVMRFRWPIQQLLEATG